MFLIEKTKSIETCIKSWIVNW